MCCNGVIFADVQLQAEDVPARLEALGLRLAARAGEEREKQTASAGSIAADADQKFCQPCAAFQEGRCRIYDQRPGHCRQFECLLLRRFREGRTLGAAALREIRKTQRQAEQALLLLRELGDTDEQLPLARRFRRTAERLETVDMDADRAQIYGRLTVAVLDLNFQLSTFFYPG